MNTQQSPGTKKVSAFDLRNVISALLGIYGIVLIGCYFFLDPGINPDTGMVKDPIDNLWAGAAMLVVAIIFALWAKLRPVVITEEEK